jgi:hypothetical protein
MTMRKNTAAAEEERPPEVDFMRFFNQLRTDVSESVAGVMLRGARPVPIGNAADLADRPNGATDRPTTSPGRLVGWSIRAVGIDPDPPADAVVRLYDGAPADGGTLVAVVSLSLPFSADTQSLSPGPGLVRGLHVEYVTGVVEGTVWLGGVD